MCYVRFLPILPCGRVFVPVYGHVLAVIVLGIVLLILGLIVGLPLLWTVGVILLVVGIVLALLGTAGHSVGGRAHYW